MKKIKITKTESKRYITIFFIFFILSLIGFIIDNIYWITASPEWDSTHTVTSNLGKNWTGAVKDYNILEKLNYIFGYRVLTVLTNWRDLLASFGIAISIVLLVMFSNEILGKRVFHKSFLK